MTFQRVEPNSHYRSLRLLSESGRWELGMSPYSHGMRMRAGLAGRPPRVIDFCMGRDSTLFPKILTAILRRLDPLQESVTPAQFDSAFPWHGTRPDMNLHLEILLGANTQAVDASGPASKC
jgi:hypothetical protein